MHHGWLYSIGPGGPSLSDPKFEESRERRQRPPRSRWIGAAAASYTAALGAAVLATQSLIEAHWVLLVGGSLWFMVAGPIFVWRRFRRHLRADPADASARTSAADIQPSWWLQPMSRRQVTVLGLPLIASSVAGIVTDSDYVAFAWVLVVGGTLGTTYLALAYLRSERSARPRRFRPAEDDSSKKWRRYRWPRGARTLR